jgi:hypothetical protein
MPRHPLTRRASVRPLTLHGRRAALCPTSVSVAIFPQMAMAGSHDHIARGSRGTPSRLGRPSAARSKRSSRAAEEPPIRAFPKRISGAAVPPSGLGAKGRRQGRAAVRRNRLQTPNGDHHAQLPCRRPAVPPSGLRQTLARYALASAEAGRQGSAQKRRHRFGEHPGNWFVDRTGVLIL